MSRSWIEFWDRPNSVYVGERHLAAHFRVVADELTGILGNRRDLRVLDHGCGEALDAARGAGVLMGMNNVYYRFLHLVGQEAYGQMPPRLRMGRVARPAGPKADFELFCLAVSAINGCATCVQAHERTLREAGLGEEQVQDALRIASTLHGLASVPA